MEPVDVEGNRAAQADEMEVLQAIYGEDCILYKDEHSCEVYIRPSDEIRLPDLPFRLRVYFPESYPSTSEPIAEMDAAWLHEEMRQKLATELQRIFLENAGNVIIFTWIEWLKEQAWLWEEAKDWMEVGRVSKLSGAGYQMEGSISKSDELKTDTDGWMATLSELLVEEDKGKDAVNEKIEDTSLEDLDKNLGIIHGAPFTEKKSTFQAHLAAVSSVDQVETVMDALLRSRKIAGATHNIMAYRISMPEKGTVLQDHDDDGETAAGGRLLHLLQIVDAVNVVVIVSRWFGGILLGPDRFKHINNAARSLLNTCGYIKSSGQSSSQNDNQKSQSKGSSQKGRRR